MPETHPPFLPVWQPFTEGGVLLTWPADDTVPTGQRVTQLSRALELLEPPQILEWVAGLDSLALLYNPLQFRPADLERVIHQALHLELVGLELPTTQAGEPLSVPLHTLPTCYHPSLAPDLLEVAQRCDLSVEAFIRQHTACRFEVALLGFAPGFAYLEGLPQHLQVPRRVSPRVRVPAGSVALGGAYCGIYPLESAGGWQLIGRTPLTLFDPRLERPSRFAVGDRVCFEAIALEDYHALLQSPGFEEAPM